uniref:Glycosyltransferase RgtA/B/C/D-like domain-containing protein n=1 Tax=Solibacter usitatus (strain Ellin6076) TaxID=234267 RepID=Q01W37_SOLUE
MRKALWKYPGAALFAGVWLIYSVCPPFLSYDSYWSVATAVSLVENASTRVDRFVASAPAAADYGVECVPAAGPARLKYAAEGCPDGHWYSYFPPGTPVLVAPLFLVLKGATALTGALVPHSGFFARREVAAFFSGDLLTGRPLTELFCGAVIGAATVWLQYRIALLFLSRRGAIWLALLFAFGTTEWSLASRNLFPHGLTLLLLSGALYILLDRSLTVAVRMAGYVDRAYGQPVRYFWAGVLLALAFCVRPSNAVSCVLLAIYVAAHQRRRLPAFLLGAAPVAVIFFAYQIGVRHSIIPLYLTAPRNSISFAEGLAMNFFSPSRGLFVFTPVFLVSLAGAVLAWRRRWCFPIFPYLAMIVVLHSLVIMTIWPGHCYGPRYFADITHLLVLFLIPAILWWRGQTGTARSALAAGFLFLAACGVFVHARGATSIAANQWSALPINVDEARGRVWDWKDAQFLRGLQ